MLVVFFGVQMSWLPYNIPNNIAL